MARRSEKPFIYHSLSDIPDRPANWPLDPSELHPPVGPARVPSPPLPDAPPPAPTVEEIDELFGETTVPNWALDPTAGEAKQKMKSRRPTAKYQPSTTEKPGVLRSLFDDTDISSPLNLVDPTQVFRAGTDALDWMEDDRTTVVPNWDLDPTVSKKKSRKR